MALPTRILNRVLAIGLIAILLVILAGGILLIMAVDVGFVAAVRRLGACVEV